MKDGYKQVSSLFCVQFRHLVQGARKCATVSMSLHQSDFHRI